MSHANDLRWYKESLQPCGVTALEFRSLDFGFCRSSSSSSSSVTGLFSGPQVMILITGAHKAFALYKAIEEGVNHMWTVSAFQQHPRTVFVCDEDATLELKVKTVKYFKGEGAGRRWPGSGCARSGERSWLSCSGHFNRQLCF